MSTAGPLISPPLLPLTVVLSVSMGPWSFLRLRPETLALLLTHSLTSHLQSISTIYLLSLQNTSWWHLEKSCVSSEARPWIQTLFLQSSDSILLPKNMMDVENVFCEWTRVPWAGNVGKSDIEVGWDQVRKGFQFGLKSLNFSPQVLEMSNILG